MTTKTENQEENILLNNDDFVKIIVDADLKCKSWREKLDWVRSAITNEAFTPNEEFLIYLSIYLRFIGTGEIACVEDGRHFRPCHHAKSAFQIEERLNDITTPSNAAIIRKIYPWMPSHDSAFVSAEPLTRIRDIAHRNDIPHELKNEIKHTLQNKLHRCAGPEDLVTSSALLERITVPGASYSHSFVEQFRIFHEELKEFFNARSLEDRLRTIISNGETDVTELIIKFLEIKESGEDTPDHLVNVLELLTELRSHLIEKAETETGSNAQQLRLADIGLEDFAFVLLSRIITGIDSLESESYWELTLYALSLTVRNLFLSGIDHEECGAIESELNDLRRDFDSAVHAQLLRIKATLDRCRRLCDEHTDSVLALFAERVGKLGRSLGIADHAVKVFCEGDIRNNLVFQFSKIVSALIKKIRSTAGLPPWEVLVSGNTSGRLVAAEHLSNLTGPYTERVVVLLKKSEGDEDIPKGVGGILLGHDMPHLSHIGVRARQDGVVFCVCEERDRFDRMEQLVGKQVDLIVTPDAVRLEISSSSMAPDFKVLKPQSVQVQEVSLDVDKRVLALEHVTMLNGGGKADSARRLKDISRLEGAGFKTPQGVLVPFGVMDEAIQAMSGDIARYRQLVSGLNEMPQNDFEESLQQLRNLIGQLNINKEMIDGIGDKFRNNERLMIRSSANCEDLEEMAGAGLYDSFANVSLSGLDDNIRKVWASLWTNRAAASRRQAGIPHYEAFMSVLIQQMLTPELSFIMHTVNPINRDSGEIYIELAAGMGETLASGAVRGSPYRMVCNKSTGEVRMLAFANYSYALWPDQSKGLIRKRVDYSAIAMSTSAETRNTLGNRLAGIGRFVEEAFGQPQDIEGVVIGEDIYLVQSRPQTGGGAIMTYPLIMALFQKRIDGDDALLELARFRFKEAGLGTEVYAGTPDELNELLRFKPAPETHVVVHMDRRVDLFTEEGFNLVVEFAESFAGKVFGLVIHDQSKVAASFDDYVSVLRELGNRLKNGPYLFIEYASGLKTDLFLEIFERIKDIENISACVDIGHIGIKAARDVYVHKHPGENVCALTPNDLRLHDVIEDVEEAVRFALPALLEVIRGLGSIKKHVHFHLHDAHPLSTFSPFGVSDHLSFLEEISIPFEYRERLSLPLMYGPSGLAEIVNTSFSALSPERISYTLEIHPTEGRAALKDASFLFDHWEDRTNAEKMNFWLSVLLQNHQLLLRCVEESIVST